MTSEKETIQTTETTMDTTIPQKYDRTLPKNQTGSNMIIMLTQISQLPEITPGSYIVALSTEGVVFGSCNISDNQQDNVPIVLWGKSSGTVVNGLLDNERATYQYISGTKIYDLTLTLRAHENKNDGFYVKDELLVALSYTTVLQNTV